MKVFVIFEFRILLFFAARFLVCNQILYSSIGKQRLRPGFLSARYKRSRAKTNVSMLSDVQPVRVNAKKVTKASIDLCLCNMYFWVANVFIICSLPLPVCQLSYFARRPGITWLRRLSTYQMIQNRL